MRQLYWISFMGKQSLGPRLLYRWFILELIPWSRCEWSVEMKKGGKTTDRQGTIKVIAEDHWKTQTTS